MDANEVFAICDAVVSNSLAPVITENVLQEIELDAIDAMRDLENSTQNAHPINVEETYGELRRRLDILEKTVSDFMAETGDELAQITAAYTAMGSAGASLADMVNHENDMIAMVADFNIAGAAIQALVNGGLAAIAATQAVISAAGDVVDIASTWKDLLVQAGNIVPIVGAAAATIVQGVFTAIQTVVGLTSLAADGLAAIANSLIVVREAISALSNVYTMFSQAANAIFNQSEDADGEWITVVGYTDLINDMSSAYMQNILNWSSNVADNTSGRKRVATVRSYYTDLLHGVNRVYGTTPSWLRRVFGEISWAPFHELVIIGIMDNDVLHIIKFSVGSQVESNVRYVLDNIISGGISTWREMLSVTFPDSMMYMEWADAVWDTDTFVMPEVWNYSNGGSGSTRINLTVTFQNGNMVADGLVTQPYNVILENLLAFVRYTVDDVAQKGKDSKWCYSLFNQNCQMAVKIIKKWLCTTGAFQVHAFVEFEDGGSALEDITGSKKFAVLRQSVWRELSRAVDVNRTLDYHATVAIDSGDGFGSENLFTGDAMVSRTLTQLISNPTNPARDAAFHEYARSLPCSPTCLMNLHTPQSMAYCTEQFAKGLCTRPMYGTNSQFAGTLFTKMHHIYSGVKPHAVDVKKKMRAEELQQRLARHRAEWTAGCKPRKNRYLEYEVEREVRTEIPQQTVLDSVREVLGHCVITVLQNTCTNEYRASQ